MSNYWVIVDISGMAYRALHTMGKLSNEGAATGVVYGCYLAIKQLLEDYDSQNLVAVFDGGHAYRSSVLPGYKASRRAKREQATPEERQARADLVRQLAELRTVHLPACGVENILWHEGYEADDLVAATVEMLDEDDAAVIVSSDGDLWQCLRPGVQWLSLHKAAKVQKMSYRLFVDTYGIEPFQWAQVKAWGGCKSDDIPSVADGIGEGIALKWLKGEISPTSAYFTRLSNGIGAYNRNMQVTKLPAPGLPPPPIKPQSAPVRWAPLLNAIGAKVPVDETQKTRTGFGF